MADHLTLNNVYSGTSQLIEQLEENLMSFFEWGLLNAGMYDDVEIYSLGSSTSPYPAPEDLKPVTVPGKPVGSVWQAPYRNWVYESGLQSSRQPIAVSGIYVNGVFSPLGGSGQAQYHIDYTNGRVVFDNAISLTSVVQANYSYKRIGLYDEDVPWFASLVFDSYGPQTDTSALPSGVPGLLKEHQLQLPLIVVESVAKQRMVPRELGDLSQWVYQDFLLHVIAENSPDRNNLVSMIVNQKDKSFYFYDTNARAADNAYALDYRNSLVPGKPLYPTLVAPSPSGYRINQCRFYDAKGSESSSTPPIFRGVVRVTLEIGL